MVWKVGVRDRPAKWRAWRRLGAVRLPDRQDQVRPPQDRQDQPQDRQLPATTAVTAAVASATTAATMVVAAAAARVVHRGVPPLRWSPPPLAAPTPPLTCRMPLLGMPGGRGMAWGVLARGTGVGRRVLGVWTCPQSALMT